MNTHEIILSIDDKFTGSLNEALEYLGLSPKDKCKLARIARSGRWLNGHRIKIVGMLKHVMLYGIVNEHGIMLHKGTSKELGEIYFKSPLTIENAAKSEKNYKIEGKYTVVRIGMIDRVEEYQKKDYQTAHARRNK